MIYYYVLKTEINNVLSTDIIEDLILLLFSNKADFISKAQCKKLKLPSDYFTMLRKEISKFKGRVPLFDVMTNNIYLINSDVVFTRINNEYYRFIDDFFIETLTNNTNKSSIDDNNMRILSYYDTDTLYKTYTKIFYESYVITSYITNCKRPSFYPGMDHITPYYKINELYYLAYDWNLIQDKKLNKEQIVKICKLISKHDIPSNTLINHQLYIYDSKAVGLVKYYSLYGSYYINVYLRKTLCCISNNKLFDDIVRNIYLENQINIMIKLIINAPVFDKTHTVYRFIDQDSYMKHLNVGDIYQDSSFMSTTRNPFYYKENYAFGYILLKINLPKNIKGIGLCIEAYSNFPSEEEIVLPPTTKYKLKSVTSTPDTIEHHSAFDLQVKKKYEFDWIGNDYIGEDKKEITISMPNAHIPTTPTIDLLKLLHDNNVKQTTMSDRLIYFRNECIDNQNNQFKSIINNIEYVFNIESYDSSTVYKKFFYYEYSDGIMITTSNPKFGNINLILEMGPEIHVNYYFRFSLTDPSAVVDLDKPEWIHWLSLLAYVVGSRIVVIHSNYSYQYKKTDTLTDKQNKTKFPHSENIYNYLRYKKKKFEYVEISPNFDYVQLDYLFNFPLENLIVITDRNELYKIYQESKLENVGDFYLYIVDNYPRLITLIEEKIDTIFDFEKNPFNNISYNLDAWQYLYNNNLISMIPSEKDFGIRKGHFKKIIGDKKIPKFKNRLRNYLTKKVI